VGLGLSGRARQGEWNKEKGKAGRVRGKSWLGFTRPIFLPVQWGAMTVIWVSILPLKGVDAYRTKALGEEMVEE